MARDSIKVHFAKPATGMEAVLAGAQFADAYCALIHDATLDARGAAERMFARPPRWIMALMALRNRIAAPFGLKTRVPATASPASAIGFFPVVSEAPDRLVAGFNDRHLDFRVVVDVSASEDGRRVIATTLVLTHNRLGRAYLAMVRPFHRIIVPAMLRQVSGPLRA